MIQKALGSVPRRPAKALVSWVLIAAILVCAAAVGITIWCGGRGPIFLSTRHPYRRIVIAAVCAFALYLLRKGMRNAAREWGVFLGRVGLLIVSLALSLLAGETAVRLLLLNRQKANTIERLKRYQRGERLRVRGTHSLVSIIQACADPLLVYELQPNLDMRFGGRALRTNRHGMRDSRDYDFERKPDSLRTVGVGDSGMFGWAMNQDVDYLSVLESNLNARADGVLYEVLNMAVPGYNTAQEVEMAAAKALRFKPDVVIVGWCENDFDTPFCVPQQENFWRKDVFYHCCPKRP